MFFSWLFSHINYLFGEAPKRSWNVRPDSPEGLADSLWTGLSQLGFQHPSCRPCHLRKVQKHSTQQKSMGSFSAKSGSIIEYYWFPSQPEDENWKKRLREKMVHKDGFWWFYALGTPFLFHCITWAPARSSARISAEFFTIARSQRSTGPACCRTHWCFSNKQTERLHYPIEYFWAHQHVFIYVSG